MPAFPRIEPDTQSFEAIIGDLRPTEALARRPRTIEAGLRALADFLALEFGERRQHRKQHVADQLVVGRQMLLCETVEADAMHSQSLKGVRPWPSFPHG